MEWVSIGILLALAVLLIIIAIATGNKPQAIPFGSGAVGLLIGAAAVWFASKPSSPTAGSTGKDFYQVILEERTPEGTTVVVAKDISGNLHFSEFDEPLGRKEVLVLEKGRFQPLPGKPEKNQTPKN